MQILLAIDGSEASQHATQLLAGQPWPEGSVVRVLSVAHLLPPTTPFFNEVAVHYEEVVKEFLEAATAIVTRAAGELEAAGLNVETAVRQGDPRAEILEEARSWGAELIVVGSHGRTGVERWLMGSVAEYVVRHAPCSVEVVRPPVPPPGPAEEQQRSRPAAQPR